MWESFVLGVFVGLGLLAALTNCFPEKVYAFRNVAAKHGCAHYEIDQETGEISFVWNKE